MFISRAFCHFPSILQCIWKTSVRNDCVCLEESAVFKTWIRFKIPTAFFSFFFSPQISTSPSWSSCCQQHCVLIEITATRSFLHQIPISPISCYEYEICRELPCAEYLYYGVGCFEYMTSGSQRRPVKEIQNPLEKILQSHRQIFSNVNGIQPLWHFSLNMLLP